jgi:hypothetical protein
VLPDCTLMKDESEPQRQVNLCLVIYPVRGCYG